MRRKQQAGISYLCTRIYSYRQTPSLFLLDLHSNTAHTQQHVSHYRLLSESERNIIIFIFTLLYINISQCPPGRTDDYDYFF